MTLPTLPTGPVHIILPPGIVGQQPPVPIKMCPTGPSGIEYNENSPTGPGSGHENQPPNQPPGTTQGPTLPPPVIVPSGPALTGPGPTYKEIYSEKHISKNPILLQIEDPSPDDPYEVNFIPTLIQYESTNLDTLTIDQTDPTNIKFTAIGGSQIDDIFGNTRTLWVAASNIVTDNTGSAITNGVVVYPHADIDYNINGTFSVNRGGYYLYTITGKVPAPGSSGNFAVVNFNPDSASLNGGRPSKMATTNLIIPSSFETTANICCSTGIFTGDTTTFKPTIQTSWSATWSSLNVIIATVYGPENAGGGGGGAIEWEIQGQYAYQLPYDTFNFVDESWTGGNWVGMNGAPYGINGTTPSHAFVETEAFVGDINSPYWYPNGQMYMNFSISPRPNLLASDITVTVEAWDGIIPTDIIVKPIIYNAGIGNFAQGFIVWFPFFNGDYVGTSFRLNISVTGIVDDHKLYFKYSAAGENGCEDAVAGNFHSGYGDNQFVAIDPFSGSAWIGLHTAAGPVPFPRRPYQDINAPLSKLHFTFTYGTMWDDPANLTFEILEDAQIWTGYVYVDGQLGETLATTATDLLNILGIEKPVITYIPPTDITTYDHPYPWQGTPVGHWVFSFPSADYFADTLTLLGYIPNPPANPPWYENDVKWPIMWQLDIKYKGISVGTYVVGHGVYATGY